ncbi:molybdenum cofactor biosynthesis protein MoaE [Erythrobacter sp.]|uniref:molybdenum cofactor biosynthesis protein MoaE n=1 Tax=Erythrobacter sp. TaxID=1042 RepID=UPI0031204DA7
MNSQVELTEDRLDPPARLASFAAMLEDEGAVASFTGRARGKAKDGSLVGALVLETYRGVTLASMQAIVDEAHEKFAISRSHVVHRAGRILPGEPIVFVATASSHRRAAFEAVNYLMDRLKTEAVFWKREEYTGGVYWIEPTVQDQEDTARWLQSEGKENARN